MPHPVFIDARLDPEPIVELYGGEPLQRDDVYRCVTRWRGWRRRAIPATHPELGLCSLYLAKAWVSSFDAMQSVELELRWSAAAHQLREDVYRKATEARRIIDPTFPFPLDHLPPFRPPTARQPMPHQLRAISAARAMGFRTLIADDMGLGKTATALWCAHVAHAPRVLVLCPASVKHNWRREILETLGDVRTIVIDGDAKARARAFAEIQHAVAKPPVAVVINYDLLIHLTEDQVGALTTFASGDAFTICDEAHALKTRTSQRTAVTRRILEFAPHRILLTGTPIRNTVDDLFSQIELIRPGTWTSHKQFENAHLSLQTVTFGKRPQTKIVGTKNVDQLNRVVRTLQIRRHKDEVLDLPPKTRTFPELDLDDETRKLYRAMKDFAVLQLSELHDDTNIFDPRAQSGVEAAMRCEQIAQGFVGGIPDPLIDRFAKSALKHAVAIEGRPNELIFPNSAKVAWILETIDSLLCQGSAPVVMSRFNAPMEWLARELRSRDIRVSHLSGSLTSAQKDATINEFQEQKTDVFLCQVVMAEGFNLVRSQDVLFFGRSWSPAVNAQAEDRCHRIGQLGTVQIQIPIVLQTIEWPIHNRLAAKDADAKQALRTFTVNDLKEAL